MAEAHLSWLYLACVVWGWCGLASAICEYIRSRWVPLIRLNSRDSKHNFPTEQHNFLYNAHPQCPLLESESLTNPIIDSRSVLQPLTPRLSYRTTSEAYLFSQIMSITLSLTTLSTAAKPISSLSADNMKFQVALTTITFVAGALASCNSGSSPGTANGECVKYYSGSGCGGSGIGSYKPTCGGNCYQYDSFSAIEVDGDGTYGTNCEAFSDVNCQNSMGSTGNTLIKKCVNFPNAKSMKCYYRC